MNIYKTNFKLESNTKEIQQELIKEFWYQDVQDAIKQGRINFVLSVKYIKLINELLDKIINIVKDVYNFNLDSLRYNNVFAYVSNNKYYTSVIHNHIDTQSISAVYYLNVPKAKGGQLEFYDDSEQNKIGYITPVTNDLVLFDSKLNHKPIKSNSSEYRIALNVGLLLYDRKR